MIQLSKNQSSTFKIAALAAAVVVAGGCASAKKEKAVMATPAPAAPAVQIVKKEKVLDATELFTFDSADLSAGGRATLDELIRATGGQTVATITVTGHTDRIGSDDYNMGLSQRRAKAVADYMIGKGVPAGSITAVGRGESEPVVQCDDTNWKALVECLAPNRRVVVEYPVVIEEEVTIEK
jgi:OOP family OmpA-OmpF porin